MIRPSKWHATQQTEYQKDVHTKLVLCFSRGRGGEDELRASIIDREMMQIFPVDSS